MSANDSTFNELHESREGHINRICDFFADQLCPEEKSLIARILNIIVQNISENMYFQFTLKHGKYGGQYGIDFTDVDLSKISLQKVVMYLKLYGLPAKIIDSGKPPGNRIHITILGEW